MSLLQYLPILIIITVVATLTRRRRRHRWLSCRRRRHRRSTTRRKIGSTSTPSTNTFGTSTNGLMTSSKGLKNLKSFINFDFWKSCFHFNVISHIQPQLYPFSTCTIGGIWTVDLGVMSWVSYLCATAAGLPIDILMFTTYWTQINQLPVSAAWWQHGSQICFANFIWVNNYNIDDNSTATWAGEKSVQIWNP